MASAIANRPTGLDLRIRRTVVGATQVDMARALGVDRQRVGHIESLLRPTSTTVGRYLEALAEVAAEDSLPIEPPR